MKNYLVFLLPACLFSCQEKSKAVPIIPATRVVKASTIAHKQQGDTIQLNFMDETGPAIAEASLDSVHPRMYVQFNTEAPGLLNATIVPTTGSGNIRFNQVIFPDKTSDGPFGTDLEIHLRQKGSYVLVIGRSLMADNPFSGGFQVTLEIEKESL